MSITTIRRHDVSIITSNVIVDLIARTKFLVNEFAINLTELVG